MALITHLQDSYNFHYSQISNLFYITAYNIKHTRNHKRINNCVLYLHCLFCSPLPFKSYSSNSDAAAKKVSFF